MKKLLVISSFIGLSLVSCDKGFLELYPETALTSATFFKTEADFEQAVNAAYVPLRAIYNENAYLLGEMHSDNAYYARNPLFGARDQDQNLADFCVPKADGLTTNTHIRDQYRRNYQIISRANQVLALIDEVEFDEQAKQNLKGQAHFLRAFAYFDLVRAFGQAPLQLEPVATREEAAQPLATKEQLYELIETEAKSAAELLLPKSQQEPGRVTSGTARMLLADLYMTQKRWSDASTVLLEIETSGEYELMPSYDQAFSTSTGNKNNMESIFEVQYKEGPEGYSSNFVYRFMPRPITASELGAIMGTGNPQNLSEEGNNTPTPDLIAAYEAGDEREEATIGYVTLSGSQWIEDTYPYVKKYVHPHSQHNNTGMNWPIYRYAETLLFLAEALNEQNQTGEAAGYLNQVRARAGLGATTASGQAELREAIFKERRVELAFENKRWYDIARTGRIQEIIAPYGERVKNNPQTYYYPEGYQPPNNAFTNLDQYFPLPADEAALTPHF
ncbi:putative outer membrane starch-binding protein [Anseongella ginsenosidimutans]|uniref:Putative outer membrane starch-binding protein n=1 Tax=Anseongella ginsenosidimutans TaxID=496056 RepID=A0A4R3KVR8_9SPHI|nr:RagB/SusD family nutrient uptake outer membrane protein [Anseongella ginsenosidimutans]QEC51854.1 RagB/SusD family nutrient uptake outer membrane protein [Anseongella ginsenosidimutans]TCS89231.1 putative outer membrane starch-binding protein [Anseongella ginsenosidimutans]